jgi:hypothetical protein
VSELAYLGLVVVVSAIGSSILWFRHRKPQSLESGVEEFSRGLSALARRFDQDGELRRGH